MLDETIKRLCLIWSGRDDSEYTPPDITRRVPDRRDLWELYWLDGITMIAVVDLHTETFKLEPTELD